jgi:hypothetical protein
LVSYLKSLRVEIPKESLKKKLQLRK